MSIALKDNAFLTEDEVKEWLKITGAYGVPLQNKILRLINTVCTRVESYIDAPVLSREFIEYADGSLSNVIMLTHSPVTEITEIIIDFNRNFDDATPVEPANFVLRGLPPLTQTFISPAVGLDGTDIVLRDDSNTAILGRVFSGSTIQSIKVTYKAGRGNTPDDVPDDLRTAALLLLEYLYMTTENRELGVGSKGVMGQSYSKKDLGESGMPKEVEALLQDYIDYAFPNVPMPQRNTFKI
jgi:hypothetical protein